LGRLVQRRYEPIPSRSSARPLLYGDGIQVWAKKQGITRGAVQSQSPVTAINVGSNPTHRHQSGYIMETDNAFYFIYGFFAGMVFAGIFILSLVYFSL